LILGFCSFLAIAVFGQTTVSALVQFDISSIPSNAVVSNVEIGLFIDREPDNTSQTMSFHRLLADWGEAASAVDNSLGAGLQAQDNDATWTHRFYNSQDTWTNQGGDFESLASASESVEENPFVAGQPLQREVWSAQGLIDDVQGWIDGDFVNYGWILIGDESKNKTAKRFISKDNPNFFAPKPQLTITYTIPGQEPASSALINETNVYHNWVEIYNPTDDVIDLSIHSLCTGATCNTIGSASAVILNGNTMLAAGEYTVVNWDMLDDTAGEVILQSSTGALDTSNMVDFIQYGAANQSNADEALAKGVWDDVNNAISISADTTMSLSLTFSADYKSGEDTGSTEWSSTGETPTLKNGIQTDAVTLWKSAIEYKSCTKVYYRSNT